MRGQWAGTQVEARWDDRHGARECPHNGSIARSLSPRGAYSLRGLNDSAGTELNRPRVLLLTPKIPAPGISGDRIRNFHLIHPGLVADSSGSLCSLPSRARSSATSARLLSGRYSSDRSSCWCTRRSSRHPSKTRAWHSPLCSPSQWSSVHIVHPIPSERRQLEPLCESGA